MGWERQRPVLYSEWVYDMLREGNGPIGTSGLLMQLQKELSAYNSVQVDIFDIVKACSYVSKVRKQYSGDSAICPFFRYWLWKVLSDRLVNGSVANVMNIIYAEWAKEDSRDSCKVEGSHDEGGIFYSKKSEFEFKQDLNPNEQQLKKYYQSCDGDYHKQTGRDTPPTVPSASNVAEYCGNNWDSPTAESYCKKFKEVYGIYCKGWESSKLECEWKPSAELFAGSPRPGSTSTWNPGSSGHGSAGEDPDDLPSMKMYKKFNQATYSRNDTSQSTTARNELETLLNNSGKANSIMGAWSCAADMGTSEPLYTDRCNFLFFWIGSQLPDSIRDDSFFNIIEKIFTALFKIHAGGKCPLEYHNSIDRSIFSAEKKVYDYYHDSSKIGQKLLTDLGDTEVTYCSRVKEAAEAYKRVLEHCGTNRSHKYCLEFERVYKNCNPQELWKQKCNLMPEKEPELRVQEHSKDKSVTAPIVSSIVATIGVPALAYFFYKYKPFFLNKRNNSGSNRKRRSTRNTFDALTEDTLTEFSTLGSTIGSMDETTVYGGRPTPRGRNNRREENRRNISYKRM